MTSSISIKGGRDGLRLYLDETAAWADLLDALQLQLERGAQFFNGARVIVDIGERTLDDSSLTTVLELMRRHGLEADALVSSSRDSRSAARSAGLAARPTRAPHADPENQNEAGFQQRTIRSGQVVRHQGHLTILGDVNNGGEVIAGGNVIVWGRVRGLVHAGALGDRSAVVCALDLDPDLIRIADLINRRPDGENRSPDKSKRSDGPAIARVTGDSISIDVWDPTRR
jgi:septum site-determining protein MinC